MVGARKPWSGVGQGWWWSGHLASILSWPARERKEGKRKEREGGEESAWKRLSNQSSVLGEGRGSRGSTPQEVMH